MEGWERGFKWQNFFLMNPFVITYILTFEKILVFDTFIGAFGKNGKLRNIKRIRNIVNKIK